MKRAFAVEHLSIAFQDKNEPLQTVVSDVSFSIGLGKGKSEIVGVVGESGSGKSMTALAAMGLLKDNARVLQGRHLAGGAEFAFPECERAEPRARQ